MVYNPSSWYWIVGGDVSKLWSSAGCAYVPPGDAGYLTWVQAGGVPSRIASEAELAEVLAVQYPAGWPPSLPEQAAILLAGGLHITSTGTSALDGVYSCDASAVAHITAEMISILANGTFADGSATVAWADMAGGQHVFPSVASWKPFATAIGSFVAAATKVMIGASATLPPNTATIP